MCHHRQIMAHQNVRQPLFSAQPRKQVKDFRLYRHIKRRGVIAMPFTKAFAMMEAGEIANSAALISLQWLALNRDRLREEWC